MSNGFAVAKHAYRGEGLQTRPSGVQLWSGGSWPVGPALGPMAIDSF